MVKAIHKMSARFSRRCISIVVLLTFLSSLVVVPVRAQILPVPGTLVTLSPGFQPPMLLGLKIHPENPLLFDFIIDQGVSQLSEDELKLETEKLVKYFLAALTIPDKEVWVNLSPYEKDRIIPDVLGQTIMGKTMLEQDYILKQLASSLTNPDEKLGQEFWAKVKAEVQSKIGNTDVAMNTFNKVWIVPAKAEVLESNGIVLVGEKRLKVMMDEERENISSLRGGEADEATSNRLPRPFGARNDDPENSSPSVSQREPNGRNDNKEIASQKALAMTSSIFRSIILPNIEKEINEGKNFADVRQIYNSVILAAWYKQALKESLLGKVYADKGKVVGVETDDKEMKQRIYEQYIAAFKKGVYNLIKEESDSATGDMIPRKYFSGGAMLGGTRRLLVRTKVSSVVVEKNLRASSTISTAMVRLAEDREPAGASSTVFERLNFITIRSGKLFAQMRREIPQLDISEFKLQDTEIIYQLFNGIYRALADRLIHEREGRSTEDLVNSRAEMAEVWLEALRVNYQWSGFNAEIKKRSEEILRSAGLDGSRDALPAVKEALISSLTADFIYQWQKMNEPQEGTGASSPVEAEVNVRAQRILQSFSESAQENMAAYAELMARKGELVIDIANNAMAKEFVRVLILNMLRHDLSNLESLSLQNWREISDVLHWIPEHLPSPGDFINQLTVLPADGDLKKVLSEREFHGKFKALVSQAVTEIKQFQNAMPTSEKIAQGEREVNDAASDELSPADQARLEELKAQPDLEKYLRRLRDPELTQDAAIVLKAPGSEKYITLSQVRIYRNSLPGIMRSANLVRMIANVIEGVDLPNEVVTLRAVRVLNDQLRGLLDSLDSNELARKIVGSKRAELEKINRGLEAIVNPVAAELSREYDEKWFVNANRLISVLRFEVLMVGEINGLAEGVKAGKVTAQDAEAKIVEWLQFLPAWAPKGTPCNNIAKALAALARQAREKDEDFIPNLENRILVNANGRGALIKHSTFYREFMRRLSALKIQPGPAASSAMNNEVGGINFDPINMNLQIKRDGQGVPLPLPQQNLEQINIQGFFPVIINIQPVNSRTLPLLLGRPLGSPLGQEKLSFLN